MALLQGILDVGQVNRRITPETILYVAPLFRHMHFKGKQIVARKMSSEGVGNYWPFATGRKVDQANLLLDQFTTATKTRYILVPNQHVGVWEAGFMPQWLARDYLTRRGHARFLSDQVVPARCPPLGFTLQSMRIDGTMIRKWFLQVDTQPEVGTEAYNQGARTLTTFFHAQIRDFLHPDLAPLGRDIIECCLSGSSIAEYTRFIPTSDT